MSFTQRDYILLAAKHLPPSSANLRLLDVGGVASDVLHERRADITPLTASVAVTHWDYAPQSIDAVLAYDLPLSDDLLAAVLAVLRPGGRLIIVNPVGEPDASGVQALQAAGYTRILVESALEGVLLRGEKPHTTADTLSRVQVAAAQDPDALDWSSYRGRYVHVLVQQTPHKPVWALQPDDHIRWRAVTFTQGDQTWLLAFSSLPKAVGLMQPAVVQGLVRDVNKVAKFSKATAAGWDLPLLLNPTIERIADGTIGWVAVDPATAAASDE